MTTRPSAESADPSPVASEPPLPAGSPAFGRVALRLLRWRSTTFGRLRLARRQVDALAGGLVLLAALAGSHRLLRAADLATGAGDWHAHAYRVRQLAEHGLAPWSNEWAGGLPLWSAYQFIPHIVIWLVTRLPSVEITQAMAASQGALLLTLPLGLFVLLRASGLGVSAALLGALLTAAFDTRRQATANFSELWGLTLAPLLLWLAWRTSGRRAGYGTALAAGLSIYVHPLALMAGSIGLVAAAVTRPAWPSVHWRERFALLASLLVQGLIVLGAAAFTLVPLFQSARPMYEHAYFSSGEFERLLANLTVASFLPGWPLWFALAAAGALLVARSGGSEARAATRYLLLVAATVGLLSLAAMAGLGPRAFLNAQTPRLLALLPLLAAAAEALALGARGRPAPDRPAAGHPLPQAGEGLTPPAIEGGSLLWSRRWRGGATRGSAPAKADEGDGLRPVLLPSLPIPSRDGGAAGRESAPSSDPLSSPPLPALGETAEGWGPLAGLQPLVLTALIALATLVAFVRGDGGPVPTGAVEPPPLARWLATLPVSPAGRVAAGATDTAEASFFAYGVAWYSNSYSGREWSVLAQPLQAYLEGFGSAETRSAFLTALAVELVALPSGQRPALVQPASGAAAAWIEVAKLDGVDVLRLPWTAPLAVAVPAGSEAGLAVPDRAFATVEEAYVRDELTRRWAALVLGPQATPARVRARSGTALDIDLRAPPAGRVLLVAVNWDEGWRARAGERALAVQRAGPNLLAVDLAGAPSPVAGDIYLRLSHDRPRTWWVGGALVALALLVSILALVWGPEARGVVDA